ncbi:MAG TPA: GDSL-type esterase/lipase family protein [Saprospiraceae bacterium]|nr:GDSL-type esterase/lipase family protein [Saprospiraceae bacterium]
MKHYIIASSTICLMACLFFSFTPAKKRARVVFFGDSITEAGVQPGGYISQLRDSLSALNNVKKYELIGSGIGGNKIYDLYLRLEEDVLQRKPDVVVLYVGVNDVWHRQMFGTGTDADKFQKFYLALIKKFQQKGIKVIACTPACIGERPGGANPLDMELDRFASIIRQVATDTQTPLCDLRRAFMAYETLYNTTDKSSGVLTTDGVHLNDAGNKLVAENLLVKLQELGG